MLNNARHANLINCGCRYQYVSFPNRVENFFNIQARFSRPSNFFRTWYIGHQILQIKICRTCKNIGSGELIVLE